MSSDKDRAIRAAAGGIFTMLLVTMIFALMETIVYDGWREPDAFDLFAAWAGAVGFGLIVASSINRKESP